MTIQPLGRGVLALSLNARELFPGEALPAFLRRKGLNLPPRTRVEAFFHADALLVVVTPPRRPRRKSA